MERGRARLGWARRGKSKAWNGARLGLARQGRSKAWNRARLGQARQGSARARHGPWNSDEQIEET